MKKFIIAPILISFMSCHQNEGVRQFQKFEKEFNLELTHANIQEIYSAGVLNIIDSFIILTNTRDDGKQIHIYNHNFKLISSSGQKGLGPGELVNPFYVTVNSENKTIWFCDMGRKRILKYPLDSLLMNQDYQASEFVPIPKGILALLLFEVHNDSLFSFVRVPQSDNLISFFDMKGNIKDNMFVKDNLKLNKVDSLKTSGGFSINHRYCYHPDKKLIAITYLSSDVISIIDTTGEVISITQGPDYINENLDMYNPFQIFTYLQGAKCDSDYVYCSYLGGPAIEKGKKKSNSPSCIHVFDWNGTPIAKLIFDTHIESFEIDHNNHRLIILSADSGDLMYCNLPF